MEFKKQLLLKLASTVKSLIQYDRWCTIKHTLNVHWDVDSTFSITDITSLYMSLFISSRGGRCDDTLLLIPLSERELDQSGSEYILITQQNVSRTMHRMHLHLHAVKEHRCQHLLNEISVSNDSARTNQTECFVIIKWEPHLLCADQTQSPSSQNV